MTGTRALRFVLIALIFLCAPLACTQTGVVGGKCRAGLVQCGGHCVDVETDPDNCGACGDVCAAGVLCSSGSCGGAIEAGVDGGSDADAAPADGGVADAWYGDGSEPEAGTGDAGHAEAGDAGDAGDAGGCTPPYDSPTQCGDCNTRCSGATPICAPSDGGFGCVPLCAAPLVQCGQQCVDTNSDPNNCGSCNNQCPTGLCQGGKCVGAKAGHIVAACIDYEQNFQSSSQTVLLGNAVFLPFANPVRILAYDEYAPKKVVQRVDRTIAWAATARGRTDSITTVSKAADVVTRLSVLGYDVFLVYDQPNAPSGSLGAIGYTWAATTAAYARAGGVIIVLSGGDGVGEMPQLLTNSNLLPVSAETSVTNSPLYNRAPTDAIGVNVLTPFASMPSTCAFTTSAVPDATTTFVVTGQPPGGPLGDPVVVHRTALP